MNRRTLLKTAFGALSILALGRGAVMPTYPIGGCKYKPMMFPLMYAVHNKRVLETAITYTTDPTASPVIWHTHDV